MSGPGHFTFTDEVRPVCELGLSASRAAEPTSWLDISCYVHEAELFSGRERFTERFSPGTASITFTNEDGWADVFGNAEMVATQTLRPGRPIRVGVIGPWGAGGLEMTRWLWRGWIDQAKPTYDPALHDIVVATCIDALGEAGASIAPTGPMQGDGEFAHARISRVLDALEWFSTKRKIGTSTTRVQVTDLGEQGIDMLGAAADSDGGVVFGDVDGDVVFRNRDWMLYDPDVPPDGGIGNVDPSVPGLPGPIYIDPVPGPVYFPDPPPFETPTVILVCADGEDGVLIEQGTGIRVLYEDAHVYLELSGHRWDMGSIPEGGCIGIGIPDDGSDPTRFDGDPDDGWTPTGFGTPVDPAAGFSIELLAYSDGNTVLTNFDVGPISPKPGSLLLLMINAVTAVPGDSLYPWTMGGAVTGGGYDWSGEGFVWSGVSGDAQTYAFMAETGRTAPEPFSVNVQWRTTSGATSKQHIATLWQIIGHRPDLPARMHAADWRFGMGSGDADGPDEPPGNGFWQMEMWDNRLDIATFTRVTDWTIAQSHADSPSAPWGASFNTVDGEWWTPSFSGAAPEAPALMAAPVEVFNDDLGSLGAWSPITGTAAPAFPVLAGGRAVGWTVGGDSLAVYSAAIPGDHWIEATIAGHSSMPATIGVFTRANAAGGGSSEFYRVLYATTAPDGGNLQFGPSTDLESTPIFPTDPFRLRLESTAGGHHRAYVDDVLVIERDDTSNTGDYVGFWTSYYEEGGTPAGVDSVRGGTGTFGAEGGCEIFEGMPDGPMTSNWQLAPGPVWLDYPVPFVIEDGAAIMQGEQEDPDRIGAAMYWDTPQPEDQVMEITITNVCGTGDGYVVLYTNISLDGYACQVVDFSFGPPGLIAISLYPGFDVDGNWPGGSPSATVTYPANVAGNEDHVVTLRFESDAAGEQRVLVDGELVLTYVDASPQVGPYVGMGLEPNTQDAGITSPRVLSACAGGGGIVRKTSWVAGYRGGASTHDVKWQDMNFGPDDLRGSSGAAVIEPNLPDVFGWGTLTYDVRATDVPLTAGGHVSGNIVVERNQVVLIFVAAFNGTDVSSALTVTSPELTFTALRRQPKGTLSHGQGAIFWAKTGADWPSADHAAHIQISWGAGTLDRLEYLAYGVDNGEAATAHSGATRGTHADGSVSGGLTLVQSAAPAATSVVLGFLAVSSSGTPEVGATPAVGWTEEIEYLPGSAAGQKAWFQLQSRSGGDNTIQWTEMQGGATSSRDAVALGVEVTVGPDIALWETSGDLIIGGSNDAFGGPIYWAQRRSGMDPNGGTTVWEMDPRYVVVI